jgi:hypothetical protein
VNNSVIFHGNNLPIGQRLGDGYVNATALCKAAGKKVSHWANLETTTAYIDALSVDAGIPASELLIEIRKGGTEQGTWVHPQVAVHLAMWLSPEFSVQVTKWVVQWISQQSQSQQQSQELPWQLPLYPDMTQETFDALPEADQQYFSESPHTRAMRQQAEKYEIELYAKRVAIARSIAVADPAHSVFD